MKQTRLCQLYIHVHQQTVMCILPKHLNLHNILQFITAPINTHPHMGVEGQRLYNTDAKRIEGILPQIERIKSGRLGKSSTRDATVDN